MKQYDDLSDMLVEEVLSDMAGTFFGSRVEIDEMVELFDTFVKKLKKKSKGVSLRAGLLNNLLMNPNTIAGFYSRLKVEPGKLSDKKEYSKEVLPEKIPLSLTDKSEYVKLILFAYESLQKACREYIHGNNSIYYGDEDEEKLSINYTILQNMSQIINEKIEKVNKQSPVCTLQYTRQFKPDTLEKENITGSGFSEFGCEGLDQKMKFQPIDFDSYNIEQYPELPKLEQVKSEISAFAKQVYAADTQGAKKALSEIKSKIKS